MSKDLNLEQKEKKQLTEDELKEVTGGTGMTGLGDISGDAQLLRRKL